MEIDEAMNSSTIRTMWSHDVEGSREERIRGFIFSNGLLVEPNVHKAQDYKAFQRKYIVVRCGNNYQQLWERVGNGTRISQMYGYSLLRSYQKFLI